MWELVRTNLSGMQRRALGLEGCFDPTPPKKKRHPDLNLMNPITWRLITLHKIQTAGTNAAFPPSLPKSPVLFRQEACRAYSFMAHGVQKEFALLVDILARLLVCPDEFYELLGHSICLDAGLPVDGRAGSFGLLDLCWENSGHNTSVFLHCWMNS